MLKRLCVTVVVGIALFVQGVTGQPSQDRGAALVQHTHPDVSGRPASASVSDAAATQVAFIPKGAHGVHYLGDGVAAERLAQGPAALAVDGSGGFWLLDTVAGHVLHLAANGAVITDWDKSTELTHGAALAVGPGTASASTLLAVLDMGQTGPRVFEYGATVTSDPLNR